MNEKRVFLHTKNMERKGILMKIEKMRPIGGKFTKNY
jgi:hypothetical protein